MTVYALEGAAPEIDATAWVAESADVIGKVRLAEAASVWFGAVLRGDNEQIDIGRGSNVQDGAVAHTDIGFPLTVGPNCTIGHKAILHGCVIEEGALVGMGATLLNGARIGAGSLVGAGALVTEGKVFPPRSLIVGAPARLIRSLEDDEVQRLLASAQGYAAKAERYRAGLAARA